MAQAGRRTVLVAARWLSRASLLAEAGERRAAGSGNGRRAARGDAARQAGGYSASRVTLMGGIDDG